MREQINFRASTVAPGATEVAYWIDLGQDPTGRVIKTWTGSSWEPITGNSEEVEELEKQLANKANKATTLSGYGISDAYTKAQVDSKVSSVYRVKGNVDLSNCVASDEVSNIVSMTQTEYNALSVKDSKTLYLIHE